MTEPEPKEVKTSITVLTLEDWGGAYAKGHHSLAEMRAALEADGREAQLLGEHDVRRTWWRKQPCICGEHKWEAWPARGPGRGAFPVTEIAGYAGFIGREFPEEARSVQQS